MGYEVTIVDLPARRLMGLSARMNMAAAQRECPALWEKLMPRWGEISGVTEECSFGVSVNMEENGGFDYWAALAVAPEAAVPSGMGSLNLRAGKYARCVVKDLKNIGEAYTFLYGEWGKTQSGHSVDFTSACFELYRRDWQETNSIDLYVPLL